MQSDFDLRNEKKRNGEVFNGTRKQKQTNQKINTSKDRLGVCYMLMNIDLSSTLSFDFDQVNHPSLKWRTFNVPWFTRSSIFVNPAQIGSINACHVD